MFTESIGRLRPGQELTMKKILTLLALFAVLMGSVFAETIGDNPDDPFERD